MVEKHHPGSQQPPWRRLGRALPPLLLALIVILFYWRLTLTNQFTWLDSGDVAQQVLPWFQFQVGELQQGRLPLWDPYLFGGQPLLGQAQPGSAYPLNWLLFALPTRHGWMRQAYLHWYWVFIHLMAVWFGYALCRDQKLTRTASFFGAALCGLGAYMGYADWPQMLNGAVWIPLVALFLLRAVRGHRLWASAACGGLALGVSVLSGHHQIPTFTALFSAGVWAWLIFRGQATRNQQATPDWRMLRAAALFFAVAALTSGLQTVPGWEYSQLAVRWVGADEPVGHNEPVPYRSHDWYSFKPFYLLGMFIPGLHLQAAFYVGLTALSLGFLGAVLSWRTHLTARIAVVGFAGMLAVALGPATPLHGILYSVVPMVEKARSPLAAVAVANVMLALLAAFGVDALSSNFAAPWLRRLERTLLAAGALIAAAIYGYFIFKQGEWTGDMRSGATMAVALALAALLAARRNASIGRRATTAGLFALLVMELGQGAVALLPQKVDGFHRVSLLATDKPLVDKIRELGPLARVEMRTEDRPHNFGDWNGVDIWQGYLASMTARLYHAQPFDRRLRELFGVQYYLAEKPQPGWEEYVTGHDNWSIWRNPNALPRAFAVHRAEAIRNQGEVKRILQDSKWDLRQSTFLLTNTAPPQLERCAAQPDDVFLLRRESNLVRLWVDMRCRGMVILSDTYYPGWTATIDGRPAPIHEAYTVMRGVVAEPGKHWIEMRYQPNSVLAGLIMTVTGLLLAALVTRRDPTPV